MEDQRKIKEAYEHIIKELEIPNIKISIHKGKFEELRKAHDSIHEFIYLAPLCIPSQTGQKISWHSKSAFLTYHCETFYSTHRSLLEALAGYYNVAYTLLRNTLELVLKGAFWECFAHRDFRDKAEVIKKNNVKIDGVRKTLIDWFEDIFKLKLSIEKDLEKTSAGIFDKISPIPEDPTLKKLIPSVRKIIEQLFQWDIFEPIPNSIDRIYKVYGNLSTDVHVTPDKTDIGRRLLKEKELFETTIIPKELNKFIIFLHEVMDIGVVIELSILSDWINQNEDVKDRLIKRLPIVEKDLQLPYASLKIRALVKEK